jgi:hypothetical protein
METILNVADKSGRLLAGLFWIAGATAAAVGVSAWWKGACPTCTGALSLILPWAGVLLYSTLGAIAWRDGRSPWLVHAMGLYVFAHACLVMEMVLLGQICIGCMVIAALALASGAILASRLPAARVTLALSVVLGATAGLLYPFDRVDDTLTRHFWPSRILERAPAFVDRKELASCVHGAPVRLLVYEDERSCRSCSSVGRRILPSLIEAYPTDLCVHRHVVSNPPRGQVLPVLVLLSRDLRLVVVEGLPSTQEITKLVGTLVCELQSSPPKPN